MFNQRVRKVQFPPYQEYLMNLESISAAKYTCWDMKIANVPVHSKSVSSIWLFSVYIWNTKHIIENKSFVAHCLISGWYHVRKLQYPPYQECLVNLESISAGKYTRNCTSNAHAWSRIVLKHWFPVFGQVTNWV